MAATEQRMRSLGLLTPMNVLALDEWEISRDRVVLNRKLGEGAFGKVCGGEFFIDEKKFSKMVIEKNLNFYASNAKITTCTEIE